MVKKRGRLINARRGQITLFMIIALLVVLGGAAFFYFQQDYYRGGQAPVDPEAEPVNTYVNDCIKTSADYGLMLLGLGGGFINVPGQIQNNPRAYLSAYPKNGAKLPYWWYDGITSIPTEDFISSELSSFVESEMEKCINDFEPFESRFIITESKKPFVETRLNENDVSFHVDYPLKIQSIDKSYETRIDRFDYTAKVRLKKIYSFAKEIMERQIRDFFLERRTIDLYSIDSRIPTTDIEASCGQKSWYLSDIKSRIKTLLRVNIPYIKIKGTDYEEDSYLPGPDGPSTYADSYYQNHYVWNIGPDTSKKYKNMKAEFIYDEWPLDIFARPSENGVLSANSQKSTNMLSFFCLKIWHFTYDIHYPVMASLVDPKSKTNDRYQFNFAFRVAIDHNEPLRVSKGTNLFELAADISSADYCNSAKNEMTIYTVNRATGEHIRDVNLTFVCGRLYCDIGQTNWISSGASAGLTEKFPYCTNGIVKGNKDGFSESTMFVQSDDDGRSFVLMMDPVRKFSNFSVVKHLLSNPGAELALNSDEKAAISISSNQSGYEEFAFYPQEAGFSFNIPSDKDAVYSLNIYLTDDENLIGGYVSDWKISKEDLKSANEIVFHVVDQGAATEDERVLFIGGLSSYSQKVPPPEFKGPG